MFYQHDTFIGVDISSGKLPYLVAVLNENGNLLALEKCALDGVMKYTGGYGSVTVGVNAPRFLSGGKMGDEAFHNTFISDSSAGKIDHLRVAEYQLKVRKIRFTPITAPPNQIPTWVQNGFRLYQQLELMFSPGQDGRSIIEVNSQACYQILLGRFPFQKTSTEGRIQRQLMLIDQGVKLQDPMAYFEEITRHRILQGILPEAMLYSARQLDALAAAFMARRSHQNPASTVSIGDDMDGWIILPVVEEHG